MVSDSTITGTDVQDGSLTGADVQDSSIASADVQDASLTGADVQDGGLGRADVGESLIRLSAAQATQSGTFKDFTGIPSWARRVVLLLYGVSTTGASDLLIQLGGGTTPVTSGYINGQSVFAWGSGVLSSTSTAGIPIYNNAATYIWSGRVVMELLEPGLNNWVVTATLNNTTTSPSMVVSSGIAALGANVLGMVRLTTASGTPTLDAGYASISWE
ncbi:MAG: hypothetical protein RLZZ611_309 [Cyanobacteriota bacterium]|jgi:hypothetical protein